MKWFSNRQITSLCFGLVILMCSSSCEKKAPVNVPFEILRMDAGIIVPEESSVLYYKDVSALQSEAKYIRISMSRKDWQVMVEQSPFSNTELVRYSDNIFSNDSYRDDGWEPQLVISNSISGILNTEQGTVLMYLFDDSASGTMDSYFFLGR